MPTGTGHAEQQQPQQQQQQQQQKQQQQQQKDETKRDANTHQIADMKPYANHCHQENNRNKKATKKNEKMHARTVECGSSRGSAPAMSQCSSCRMRDG
jgi:transcription initiation factor TFIID subunit TAF12